MIPPVAYIILPALVLVASGMAMAGRSVASSLVSKFQHFAGGVVLAAVGLELLPAAQNAGSTAGLVVGFCAGFALLLALQRFGDRFGMILPVSADLFLDGLLLMIGFATGEKGGILLLIALTLETLSLGLATGPSLSEKGQRPGQILVILTGFAVALFLGAGFGLLLPTEQGFGFAAFLGFGIAAMLYLVVEELMVEAHERPDSPLTTAMFFIGFLLPLLLVQWM